MGATSIIGGTLLGGLGLAGSAMQANAASGAADTVANADMAGQQLQYQEWLQQQANMQPWLNAGTAGVNALAYGMGLPGYTSGGVASGPASRQGGLLNIPAFSFDPTQIANDPDYQWTAKQGVNALAASGAAAGNYGSGNMGTALDQFGQNNAANFMNQYYNQALNTYGQNLNSQYTMPYDMLAGLSNTGQSQSQALASLGLQSANTIGQYGVGAANALASGQLGVANAYAGGLNSLASQIAGGYNSYLQGLGRGDSGGTIQTSGAGRLNPLSYSGLTDYGSYLG
jgi:hypothetical protein